MFDICEIMNVIYTNNILQQIKNNFEIYVNTQCIT